MRAGKVQHLKKAIAVKTLTAVVLGDTDIWYVGCIVECNILISSTILPGIASGGWVRWRPVTLLQYSPKGYFFIAAVGNTRTPC